MATVSTKRQITIPIDQCREANIQPGDQIDTYIYNGQITIIKKEQGAAKGILAGVKIDKRMTDRESLSGHIAAKNSKEK